jgi:hypothetical protein
MGTGVRRPHISRATKIAGTIAIVAGLVIGFIDSRPGFDATAITAVLLALAAGLATTLDPRRWLLWTAIVAGPLILLEVPPTNSPAPMAALVFAGIGAAAGWLASRGGVPRVGARR